MCSYVCTWSFFAVPSDLSVSLEENIESLSVDLQWDAVNNSPTTIYTVTWDSAESSLEVLTLTEQTSYTITGLTLDTVYTITVTTANDCGIDQGPGFRTNVILSTDTTSITATISSTVTASTNPMTIVSASYFGSSTVAILKSTDITTTATAIDSALTTDSIATAYSRDIIITSTTVAATTTTATVISTSIKG